MEFPKNTIDNSTNNFEALIGNVNRKLSIKARKRLFYLQSKGVEYDKALLLCRRKLIPVSHIIRKKKNSYKKNYLPKNIKATINDIVPMNKGQLLCLRQAIIAEVDKIPEGGPKPRFKNCILKDGYLLVACVDKVSLEWLRELVKAMQPWPEAKLKLTDHELWYLATVWIPGVEKEPAELILQRLERQNAGLNCTQWKILSVEPNERGQTLLLALEPKDNEALEKVNYNVFLNFRKANIRVSARKGSALKTYLNANKTCDTIDMSTSFTNHQTNASETNSTSHEEETLPYSSEPFNAENENESRLEDDDEDWPTFTTKTGQDWPTTQEDEQVDFVNNEGRQLPFGSERQTHFENNEDHWQSGTNLVSQQQSNFNSNEERQLSYNNKWNQQSNFAGNSERQSMLNIEGRNRVNFNNEEGWKFAGSSNNDHMRPSTSNNYKRQPPKSFNSDRSWPRYEAGIKSESLTLFNSPMLKQTTNTDKRPPSKSFNTEGSWQKYETGSECEPSTSYGESMLKQNINNDKRQLSKNFNADESWQKYETGAECEPSTSYGGSMLKQNMNNDKRQQSKNFNADESWQKYETGAECEPSTSYGGSKLKQSTNTDRRPPSKSFNTEKSWQKYETGTECESSTSYGRSKMKQNFNTGKNWQRYETGTECKPSTSYNEPMSKRPYFNDDNRRDERNNRRFRSKFSPLSLRRRDIEYNDFKDGNPEYESDHSSSFFKREKSDTSCQSYSNKDYDDRAKRRGLTTMLAPSFRSYKVRIVNCKGSKKRVLLGISSEQIAIEPLTANKYPNKSVMDPVVLTIDQIVECEVLSDKRNKVYFRIHYARPSSGRSSILEGNSTAGYLGLKLNLSFIDFEGDKLMAEVIVNKINMILNMKYLKSDESGRNRIIPFY